MKIVSQPIDAVVIFRGTARPVPFRFRYAEPDGSVSVITVGKILSTEERRTAGQRSYLYDCQSEIDGIERRYQLKFLLQEARWVLYKI